MIILLARHGDTFASGEPVTWVGARNDLALTSRGEAQARELGEWLKATQVQPEKIIAGPLSRTLHFAQICSGIIGAALPVSVDERLGEIDYGEWSGLTSDEVVRKFGAEALELWEKQSTWPRDGGWKGSAEEFTNEVKALTQELSEAGTRMPLLVSSNGRLRYFLNLVPSAFEQHLAHSSVKMRTGALSALRIGPNPKVLFWNKKPIELGEKEAALLHAAV